MDSADPRTTVRRIVSVALLVGLVLPGVGSASRLDDAPARTGGAPDDLAPVLAQLVNASDRAAFAADHGLTYRNGTVRVVIELEPDATPPPEYDVREETAYTDAGTRYVQAFVAVDDLAPLAAEPTVKRVRPPSTVHPVATSPATAPASPTPAPETDPPTAAPGTPGEGTDASGRSLIALTLAVLAALAAIVLYRAR